MFCNNTFKIKKICFRTMHLLLSWLPQFSSHFLLTWNLWNSSLFRGFSFPLLMTRRKSSVSTNGTRSRLMPNFFFMWPKKWPKSMWKIWPSAKFRKIIDLSEEKDTKTQELKIKQTQENDRLEPYKLEQGNLFRIYLIKRREDLYTCIFSNHHAILDGWSNPILLEYVHSAYLKLENKDTISYNIDYSYINTQKYLQKHQEDNKEYWDNYISI